MRYLVDRFLQILLEHNFLLLHLTIYYIITTPFQMYESMLYSKIIIISSSTFDVSFLLPSGSILFCLLSTHLTSLFRDCARCSIFSSLSLFSFIRLHFSCLLEVISMLLLFLLLRSEFDLFYLLFSSFSSLWRPLYPLHC